MMHRSDHTQAAVVLLLGGALLGALAVTVLGGLGPGQMMGSWGSPYAMAYGMHAWVAVVLTPLVLLCALLLAAVLVVRVREAAGQDHPGQGTTQDVLRRRFATGEITREEYQQMHRALEP